MRTVERAGASVRVCSARMNGGASHVKPCFGAGCGYALVLRTFSHSGCRGRTSSTRDCRLSRRVRRRSKAWSCHLRRRDCDAKAFRCRAKRSTMRTRDYIDCSNKPMASSRMRATGLTCGKLLPLRMRVEAPERKRTHSVLVRSGFRSTSGTAFLGGSVVASYEASAFVRTSESAAVTERPALSTTGSRFVDDQCACHYRASSIDL